MDERRQRLERSKLQCSTRAYHWQGRYSTISTEDRVQGHTYLTFGLAPLVREIYLLSAVQFLGSFDSGIGLPSVSRWVKSHQVRVHKRQAHNKNDVYGITTGLDMMTVQAHYEQKLQEAKNDLEREALTKEMEKAASENLLKVLWTTTVADITSTLHEVAQIVLFDQSVDKNARSHRAEGLRALGQIFLDTPTTEEDGSEMT
jgi:X-domain of DnaJ-containing